MLISFAGACIRELVYHEILRETTCSERKTEGETAVGGAGGRARREPRLDSRLAREGVIIFVEDSRNSIVIAPRTAGGTAIAAEIAPVRVCSPELAGRETRRLPTRSGR